MADWRLARSQVHVSGTQGNSFVQVYCRFSGEKTDALPTFVAPEVELETTGAWSVAITTQTTGSWDAVRSAIANALLDRSLPGSAYWRSYDQRDLKTCTTGGRDWKWRIATQADSAGRINQINPLPPELAAYDTLEAYTAAVTATGADATLQSVWLANARSYYQDLADQETAAEIDDLQEALPPNLYTGPGRVIPSLTPGVTMNPFSPGGPWAPFSSLKSIFGAAWGTASPEILFGTMRMLDLGGIWDWLKTRAEGLTPEQIAQAINFLQGNDPAAQPDQNACCAGGEAVRVILNRVTGGNMCPNPCGGSTNGATPTNGMVLAVPPEVITRTVRRCPKGADGVRWRLGKDGMCRPGLTDKQRLYPSRKAKVSKGQWNKLMQAKNTARTMETINATLDEISRLTKRKVRTKTKVVCYRCKKNPCTCDPR